MANKVPDFGINTSSIKDIKSTYKAKEESKSYRMRGMTKHQEAKMEPRRRPGRRLAEQGELQGRSSE